MAEQFWQDKRVIITGASSGIGAALAKHLATAGARVGLIARREDRLAELSASIRAGGGRAIFVPADVVDQQAIAAAVQAIEHEVGLCDVAVACAGIYRKTSVTSFDAAAANSVITTNVQGVINLFGAIIPGMIERQSGRLAAVASVAGFLGLPGAGAYSASKAAILKLLDALRVDLHPYGIKVSAISPGFVDTSMITDEERATLKHLVSAPEAARRIARTIARGRAEHWFPWQTAFAARLASWLPPGLYRRVMSHVDEMEESAEK